MKPFLNSNSIFFIRDDIQYSKSFLKQYFYLTLKGKEPSTITSIELEDLGYLVSGLTPEEIGQISASVFSDAVATLGDIDDLDKETIAALADKAVSVYK